MKIIKIIDSIRLDRIIHSNRSLQCKVQESNTNFNINRHKIKFDKQKNNHTNHISTKMKAMGAKVDFFLFD